MRLLLPTLLMLALLPLRAESPPAGTPAPEPDAPAGSTARYRLLHAIPRGAALAVFVDGAEAVTDLGFGTLTEYQTVAAGVHAFEAADPTGVVLAAAEAPLAVGYDYTIAIRSGPDAPSFLLITDHEPVPRGDELGRVRATNLVADTDFVFAVDERLVAALLRPGQSTPQIAAGVGDRIYQFKTAAPGGPEFAIGPASVPPRSTFSCYVVGLAGAEDESAVRVIEDLQPWPSGEQEPTEPPSSVTRPPNTRLRVLHLAGGSGALDGTLDGKPLFANLAFGDLTPYLPQTPGEHDVAPGDAGEFADPGPIELRPEQAHTLVICGEPGRLRRWVLVDEPGRTERPCLRVVHVGWQAPPLAVDRLDGENLVPQISYLSYEGYLPLGDLPLGQLLSLGLRPVGQSTVVQAARVAIEPSGAYTLYLADSGTSETRAVRLKLVRDGGS